MLRVVPVKGFGIAENGRGFFKRHAMLLQVAESFPGVPRKHISVYTLIRVRCKVRGWQLCTGNALAPRPFDGSLVEEAGLLVGDALEEGLELEPADKVRAHEGVGAFGGGVGNFVRRAGGLGEQLRLAGAVHGDEPPGSFVHSVANGEQAMIAEDGGFLRAEGAGDAVAFGGFLDDAGVIIENNVILVKGASILGERIEQTAKSRPRLAVQGMRVRGGDDVGARGVYARVDGEGGEIDFRPAFDDSASVIHQSKVRGANLAEVHAKGIHPEMIELLGIARGDVAGDAFIKAEAREEAKSSGEPLFAMAALFGGSGKDGRARNAVHEGAAGRRSGGRGWLRHGNLREAVGWRDCASARSRWEERSAGQGCAR